MNTTYESEKGKEKPWRLQFYPLGGDLDGKLLAGSVLLDTVCSEFKYRFDSSYPYELVGDEVVLYRRN